MALVACSTCRQPFYASCHDSSCLDAICPYCEYGDDAAAQVLQAEDLPQSDGAED